MAFETAPPIGNFPGAQQRFGFTGTNPGEKSGVYGGGSPGGFGRGSSWLMRQRQRRPDAIGRLAMLRSLSGPTPIEDKPYIGDGGGTVTPKPPSGGGTGSGIGSGGTLGGLIPKWLYPTPPAPPAPTQPPASVTPGTGDGYASDKPYGGGLPQLPNPPKYGGGGRGGYESEYGYVDNGQNNPKSPYDNPGGKGRPGEPGYYVGDNDPSKPNPLYEKPFNYGNVYGRELGQPEAYPGFRPLMVRKEDWAGMTPEQRFGTRGGPESELRRLSDWSVNFRHGGFRIPRPQRNLQGYPTGYGSPDDMRKRLAALLSMGTS